MLLAARPPRRFHLAFPLLHDKQSERASEFGASWLSNSSAPHISRPRAASRIPCCYTAAPSQRKPEPFVVRMTDLMLPVSCRRRRRRLRGAKPRAPRCEIPPPHSRNPGAALPLRPAPDGFAEKCSASNSFRPSVRPSLRSSSSSPSPPPPQPHV